VTICKKDGSQAKATVDSILVSSGVGSIRVKAGSAGEIIQLTGMAGAQIGETVADDIQPEPLPVWNRSTTLKIYLGPILAPSKALRVNSLPAGRLANG